LDVSAARVSGDKGKAAGTVGAVAATSRMNGVVALPLAAFSAS
jgi:hypothetical protein